MLGIRAFPFCARFGCVSVCDSLQLHRAPPYDACGHRKKAPYKVPFSMLIRSQHKSASKHSLSLPGSASRKINSAAQSTISSAHFLFMYASIDILPPPILRKSAAPPLSHSGYKSAASRRVHPGFPYRQVRIFVRTPLRFRRMPQGGGL